MKILKIGTILLILAAGLLPAAAEAQISFNWDEWFRQKKTEKKYLARQIVQLQLYLHVLRQGYNIAQSGLQTVHAVKNGEFNLHDVFYLSMQRVSPAVKGMPEASRIVERGIWLQQEVRTVRRLLRRDTLLLPAQKDAFEKVCTSLMDRVSASTDDLESVLTNDRLRMTEDKRIDRIYSIDKEMEGHYLFGRGLREHAASLALGRKEHLRHTSAISILYGLK